MAGMTPAEAVDFLCVQARLQGADAWDVVAGYGRSQGLNAFAGSIQNTEISESAGIGVRLFRDGRPGYASTERFTREALVQTVADAMQHTAFTDPLDIQLPAPESPHHSLVQYEPELESFTLERMAEVVLAAEKVALAADPEVVNVPYLGAGNNVSRSWFANSNGIFQQDEENDFSVGIGAVAARGDVRKMGVYSRSGRDLALADPQAIALEAVRRSVELLGASAIPGGDYPVVFSNRVSPQIFSIYASSFFGDVVQKGQSRLAGRLGERIAVERLRVWSDPTRPDLPGSGLFDGEGVAQRKVEVVQDGVLLTYLHNLESAKREGLASTGSASRSYSGRVGTSFGNLIVDAGPHALSDLLAAYPRCLYITKLDGASGCSAISGQFSIGAQGFLVEAGQKVHPLDGITLSGNFFSMLGELEGIGSAYSDAWSSVKVPDVLFTRLGVSS